MYGSNMSHVIATSVLRTERRTVEAKMAQLQEELNLIAEHEESQQKKLAELEASENEVQQRVASVYKTIDSLEVINIWCGLLEN